MVERECEFCGKRYIDSGESRNTSILCPRCHADWIRDAPGAIGE